MVTTMVIAGEWRTFVTLLGTIKIYMLGMDGDIVSDSDDDVDGDNDGDGDVDGLLRRQLVTMCDIIGSGQNLLGNGAGGANSPYCLSV